MFSVSLRPQDVFERISASASNRYNDFFFLSQSFRVTVRRIYLKWTPSVRGLMQIVVTSVHVWKDEWRPTLF